MDINIVWFFLVGVLLTGYALLDGFDLGVGALHLFTKKDEDRRVMLNAIGPVWDGNEVWLVTGGGALFAAFPKVYATVFSGFYTAFMLLLFCLIFRAVSIEFRSKEPMGWWRKTWDIAFSVSSILVALVMGVAVGNIIWGIPLTKEQEFMGSFFSLFHPYTLLIGITTVVLFVMHGATYALMKAEGDLQASLRGWAVKALILFAVCYVVATISTFVFTPHMTRLLKAYPILFALPVVNILAISNIPREIQRGRYSLAFLSSCINMVVLMILFGIGIFPNLVLSVPNPEWSLTLYNAASSQKTLKIMLTIVLIGMPLVIAYTAFVYWVFRGKVKLESTSY